MSSIKHVAIYGKGGIGKSCTASNVAAACAEDGHREFWWWVVIPRAIRA